MKRSVQSGRDQFTAGLSFSVFVSSQELGVTVQPKGNAVQLFDRQLHAVVSFVQVVKQLGRTSAEFARNRAAASVNASCIEAMDKRLVPEAVMFGQAEVRPSVGPIATIPVAQVLYRTA